MKPDETFTVKGDNLTIYFGPVRKRIKHQILDMYKFERRFLCNKILKVKPSVLHAHWQYEHALGALDSKIPALITCRDSPIHVLRYLPGFYRVLRLFVAVYVVNKAKHISATSNYLARNIKLLAFNKPVKVIPNFEPDWIFSLYKRKRVYSNIPNIVMINNGFQKRKNVEVGIRAFQIIRKHFPSSTLHLYGNGFKTNGPAYNWSLANNLSENVYFCGLVNFKELMNALSGYNILVHTAKEETFGNILAEAMAQGIPVVGGNKSGAVPEVIGENGLAGMLVDITSPEKVAEAILKIFSSDEIYSQFSENARAEALKKFQPDNVVSAYEEIYTDLLNGI